jgi:hypothetical protein
MCMTCAIRRHQPAWALLGALALAACALLSGAASAAATSTTTTLTGGDLSISQTLTAGAFAGTLSGAAQSLSAAPADGGTAFSGFQISDARGSGVGWNVTVSAGQLVSSDGSGHVFALGSLTMAALVVAGAADSSAVPGTLHGAAAIDNSADGSTGGVVMAATSAFAQGMGTYDFTNVAPWTLAVPAGAYAGTYSSTVTTTLATLGLAPSSASAVLFSTDFSSMAGLTVLLGLWQIENGVLVPVGTGEHRLAFGDTAWTNVQINVNATLSSGRGYGIYFRSDGKTNISGYCFQFDCGWNLPAGSFVVRKVVNGAESSPIASAPMPAGYAQYGVAHMTSVSADGSHIVCKVDGVTVLDFNNSTFASGCAGLRSWDGNVTVGFMGAQVLSRVGTP